MNIPAIPIHSHIQSMFCAGQGIGGLPTLDPLSFPLTKPLCPMTDIFTLLSVDRKCGWSWQCHIPSPGRVAVGAVVVCSSIGIFPFHSFAILPDTATLIKNLITSLLHGEVDSRFHCKEGGHGIKSCRALDDNLAKDNYCFWGFSTLLEHFYHVLHPSFAYYRAFASCKLHITISA